jgi:PAS domain S-box-containing protein
VVLSSIITIWFTYRNSFSALRKRQAKVVIFAMIVPMTFGTITNGILPALQIAFFPIGVPMTSFMAFFIAMAIYKYGLFELSSIKILSSIGNGVITINKQRKIVQINEYAADKLGVAKSTVMEKSLSDVVSIRKTFSNHDNSKENNPLPYVLQTREKIKSHDFFMRVKHKRTIPIECTISPVIQSGELIGATIVFRDYSKEKAIEQSKNEFISIASHELKTPMTSVIAYSQILEKSISKLNNKKNNYLIHSMNEQLHKMKNLIEDLLDVSRIENGMFTLNKQVYPINTLIEKAVKDMQYTSDMHEIIRVGRSQKKIAYDVDRIYQVLINLITNAIKYSPKAKKIYVLVKEFENELVISVEDFGIGIPQRDQVKIFDRFYRSQRLYKNTIAGFGLGLYICSEIIRNHNGKIWVESKENKGSTFSFSLPYIE